MVYLLNMVIFHGELLNNQMVLAVLVSFCQINHHYDSMTGEELILMKNFYH